MTDARATDDGFAGSARFMKKRDRLGIFATFGL
jgi:hypothetical protein